MSIVKEKVRNFLCGHFKNHDFADDEDIFASGYANSLFAMQLICMVEKEFSITLDNEDLHFDNFRSVNAVARFVASKQAVAVGT